MKKKNIIVTFSIIGAIFFFLQNPNYAQLKTVSTDKAPAAIGPYSQAVKTGNLLFLSGQISLDPVTMNIIGNDIESQTGQIFKNIRAVLLSENLTLENIVKCTVFMKNLDDFGKMNEIYAKEFGAHKPARSTVQVARLPKDVLIEIECVAVYEK